MNYDDHEDFNKARTAEEATKEFANAREAVFDKARSDFSGGVQDGIVFFTVGAIMLTIILAATS
jgi:hypothetical protein